MDLMLELCRLCSLLFVHCLTLCLMDSWCSANIYDLPLFQFQRCRKRVLVWPFMWLILCTSDVFPTITVFSLFWIVKIFCWEGFERSTGLLPRLYLYLWPLLSSPFDGLFPPSIYLATLGLNCGVKDLLLWHVGSSSLTRDQAWAPCLRSAVLTTGPSGKSASTFLSAWPNRVPLYRQNAQVLGGSHHCESLSCSSCPSCFTSEVRFIRKGRVMRISRKKARESGGNSDSNGQADILPYKAALLSAALITVTNSFMSFSKPCLSQHK